MQHQTEECNEEERSTRNEVEEVNEQMEQVDQQLEGLKDKEIDISVRGGACRSLPATVRLLLAPHSVSVHDLHVHTWGAF